MRTKTRHPVNDISQCVEQANRLARHMKDARQRDLSFHRAFSSLAGDKTIGLLAFAIWRGRSQLLSTIHSAAAHQVAEADASGVSHA